MYANITTQVHKDLRAVCRFAVNINIHYYYGKFWKICKLVHKNHMADKSVLYDTLVKIIQPNILNTISIKNTYNSIIYYRFCLVPHDPWACYKDVFMFTFFLLCVKILVINRATLIFLGSPCADCFKGR